jgi:hypothetical protein
MQRAEDSSRLVSESERPRTGLRPTTAFVLLLLLVAAVGAAIYLTRPTPAPTPSNTTKAAAPDFSLTDAEAIVRLEKLDALRQQAYSDVDPSLLNSIYASGSEVLRIALSDLKTLTSDRVRDESSYSTRFIDVRRNTPSRIVIIQHVEVAPHFIRNSGQEVTSGPQTIRRTIRWVMELLDSEWLIADSVITKARVIRE